MNKITVVSFVQFTILVLTVRYCAEGLIASCCEAKVNEVILLSCQTEKPASSIQIASNSILLLFAMYKTSSSEKKRAGGHDYILIPSFPPSYPPWILLSSFVRSEVIDSVKDGWSLLRKCFGRDLMWFNTVWVEGHMISNSWLRNRIIVARYTNHLLWCEVLLTQWRCACGSDSYA